MKHVLSLQPGLHPPFHFCPHPSTNLPSPFPHPTAPLLPQHGTLIDRRTEPPPIQADAILKPLQSTQQPAASASDECSSWIKCVTNSVLVYSLIEFLKLYCFSIKFKVLFTFYRWLIGAQLTEYFFALKVVYISRRNDLIIKNENSMQIQTYLYTLLSFVPPTAEKFNILNLSASDRCPR